ncbi:MAG: hypothetical protein CVT72_15410, partial [Alphaproteobacteria bacterium HGW-Alphaproteobacteria-11]
KQQAKATEYDFPAWFFGRHGDPLFPRSCGYSLGYALVKRYLKRTSSTAAKSATMPASEIIDPWLKGDLAA